MVRFSDMLGGSGDADEPRAQTETSDLPAPIDEAPEPDAAPADDAQLVDVPAVAPAPEDEAERPTAERSQSAEEVLDRLTQYASSARAAERVVPPDPAPPETPPPPPPARPEAANEPDANPRDEPPGDDLLPRSRRVLRRPGRDPKRRS